MTIRQPDWIPDADRHAIQEEVQEVVDFIAKYYEVDGIFDTIFYRDFACYLYGLNLKKEFDFTSDSE